MQKVMEAQARLGNDRLLERGGIEIIRRRIGILNGKDKELMSLYYIDGLSFHRIASLLGINRISVSRRIRRITCRIMAGQYIRCLRYKQSFNPIQIQIAREHYIRGKTMRQIAQNLGISFHDVRKTIEKIEAITTLNES
jgi:DNA-directed RNA polymerase specialized sigma subunit